MEHDVWDVIVAGGGPAGLSAALMLGRARRRVLVIDAATPRNRFASHMHGVLGQEGIAPDELVERGRAEVADYGVEFTTGSIERLEHAESGLHVTTSDGTTRYARALIAATGLRDELPEVPGLAERWGITVLHCPYCHGWEVRDQHLGVLTTSPMSLHQAELIRQWSDRVTVFTHGLGEVTSDTEQRLRSRGIQLEPAAVAEILGEGTKITAVRLVDGREVSVDALFTAGAPRPHEDFLAPLRLAREETPFGSFLAVDAIGRTSDEKIWAVGNIVRPAANVPLSIGAGSFTGAGVNAALVTWDFDDATEDGAAADGASPWPRVAPAGYWEDRYSGSDRVWSGNVNQVLADTALTLTPGLSLDLGCGEGADVIWLAQHGWDATGIDISPSAIAHAIAAAETLGTIDGRAQFLNSDLTALPEGSYDLVSASFLHSPATLPREEILRQATSLVASGGHLLITSHAAFPPWVKAPASQERFFRSPEEELALLELNVCDWEVIHAETRSRETTTPEGDLATLDDVVVLVRRR